MDATLWIDHRNEILVLRMEGNASYTEMVNAQTALNRVVETSARPDTPRRLIDLSGCSVRRMSHDQIILAARGLSQWSTAPDARRAIVAPENASSGDRRVFEAYAEFVWHRMQVFGKVEAACEWLGLPRGYMDRLDDDEVEVAPLLKSAAGA